MFILHDFSKINGRHKEKKVLKKRVREKTNKQTNIIVQQKSKKIVQSVRKLRALYTHKNTKIKKKNQRRVRRKKKEVKKQSK